MSATVEVARAPSAGVWRVGRGPDPLSRSPRLERDELLNPRTGNRFDSPLSVYSPLYFATKLDGCFGETLARFRPDTQLLAVIGTEWQELGFMNLGEVPRDWRQRRLAVRVRFEDERTRFPNGIQFLDLDSAITREGLRQELAAVLAYYGHPDMDAATVHSHDRRVTRWIGQWAYDAADDEGRPLYAGIRYSSRLDPKWECWAVFEDVPLVELVRQPIHERDAALQRVAKTYGLKIF
jgi:hypothetical protein